MERRNLVIVRSSSLLSQARGYAQRYVNDSLSQELMRLNDIEIVFGWRLSSYGFHFFEAGGTYRVKTEAVLGVLYMLRKLRFEQDEFFAREEAFEERILSPGAEAGKDFENFHAPAIIWDVVSNDIAHGLIGWMRFHKSRFALSLPI